jgi:hypothetical protein
LDCLDTLRVHAPSNEKNEFAFRIERREVEALKIISLKRKFVRRFLEDALESFREKPARVNEYDPVPGNGLSG